jgi:hypothetical protein
MRYYAAIRNNPSEKTYTHTDSLSLFPSLPIFIETDRQVDR